MEHTLLHDFNTHENISPDCPLVQMASCCATKAYVSSFILCWMSHIWTLSSKRSGAVSISWRIKSVVGSAPNILCLPTSDSSGVVRNDFFEGVPADPHVDVALLLILSLTD